MTIIRPLKSDDYEAWLPLWDGNNLGMRHDALTAETWKRLMDSSVDVYGLAAFSGPEMVGLVHYILHPTTGSIEPVCYMQDVFVNPAHREKGIARSLVNEVARIGRAQKWARMYWLAEADNYAAQRLYKSIGVKLDFTLHILPLQGI